MIRIDSGYFIAGVIFNNQGVVVRAAPIVKYMKGWSKDSVIAYATRKGWQWEVIL